MPTELKEKDIKTQAIFLADEARKTDPEITKIFWFPATDEVRLVEVATDMKPTKGQIEPFYFPPSLPDKLPALSGVAVIRAGEEFQIPLPAGWGSWSDAQLLK